MKIEIDENDCIYGLGVIAVFCVAIICSQIVSCASKVDAAAREIQKMEAQAKISK